MTLGLPDILALPRGAPSSGERPPSGFSAESALWVRRWSPALGCRVRRVTNLLLRCENHQVRVRKREHFWDGVSPVPIQFIRRWMIRNPGPPGRPRRMPTRPIGSVPYHPSRSKPSNLNEALVWEPKQGFFRSMQRSEGFYRRVDLLYIESLSYFHLPCVYDPDDPKNAQSVKSYNSYISLLYFYILGGCHKARHLTKRCSSISKPHEQWAMGIAEHTKGTAGNQKAQHQKQNPIHVHNAFSNEPTPTNALRETLHILHQNYTFARAKSCLARRETSGHSTFKPVHMSTSDLAKENRGY